MPTKQIYPSVLISSTLTGGYAYSSWYGGPISGSAGAIIGDGDMYTSWRRDVAAGSTASNGTVTLGMPANSIPAGSTITNVNIHLRGKVVQSLYSGVLKVYARTPSTGSRNDVFNFGNSGTIDAGGNVYVVDWNQVKVSGGGGDWAVSDIDNLRFEIEYGAKTGTGTALNEWIAEIMLEVTYDPAVVPAPTSVTPANAATVTVPNPALGATLVASTSGQKQLAEWQFATDSGFTTNVQTVREMTADLRVSGATTENPPISQLLLSNGTWYVRARGVDEYGTPGAWSGTNTITVNTPVLPTPTTITPVASSTVTTLTPTIGATIVSDGAGRLQKMEWQISTDSAFGTVQTDVVETDSDFITSGAATESVPTAQKLTSDGTYYIRARSIGNDGTTSAWTTTQSFTLDMPAPPVPTAITPVNGATIVLSLPTLGATLGAATEGRAVKAEWQLATDSGFTANVRTITESSTDLRASGATTEVVPLVSKLFQAVWYMRCREVDQYGQYGSYSATQSFTVAHAPTAAPTSPLGNAAVLYASTTHFTWNFSDPAPSDAQTAYQIVIERNDSGALVADSGKVTTATTNANLAIPSTYKDITLRWKIRVWDGDNVVGNYSPYQLFILSDNPIVTITGPTNGSTVTTGQPTVTWNNDGPTVQAYRRIVFRKAIGNVVIWDTGTVASSSRTYTTPQTILTNGVSYNVTVTVTDTLGMVGSSVSNFTVTYASPDPVAYTVDASGFEDQGKIVVDWSTQIPDLLFVSWMVYRRLQGASTWDLLTTIDDPTTVHYDDWMAASQATYEYAVTQTAARSGLILESVIDSTPVAVLADGSHYWFIDPYDSSFNVKLDHVKGDEYSDEWEQEEFIVIGRGRKLNQGTRGGYKGTLTAELRDNTSGTARGKRLKLELLKESRTHYFLRDPFGDLFQVSIGAVSFTRVAGVGTAEFLDVTIPYSEVF